MEGRDLESVRLRIVLSFVLVVALSLPAWAAGVAIPFTDGTFNTIDWEITIFHTEGNGGFVTASQALAGGNPGAFRQITSRVNSAPPYSMVLSFHRYLAAAAYDPSIDGPIACIDYSEDAILISGGGGGQGAGPAIRQGGLVFVGPRFGTSERTWTPHVYYGLTASDFQLWPSDPERHPDFSESGAPITVGFYRGNSTGGSGYTIVGGIDNWSLTIQSGDSPPTGACCFGDGSCLVLGASECGGLQGNYLGNEVPCLPNPCPPLGACCFCDGHCTVLVEGACLSQGGIEWLGAGTSCTPNPCTGGPVGACCLPDGQCLMTIECVCDEQGGTFDWDIPACDPNPCPPPARACCICNDLCVVLTEEDCRAEHGLWEPDIPACSPNPCFDMPGACCLSDGCCVFVGDCACRAFQGTFYGAGTVCDPDPCDGYIPGLDWQPAEVVDRGVTQISGGAGPSAGSSFDHWFVTYEKDGDIYVRVWSDGGWQPVERLTDDPAPSRNPKIAHLPGGWQVVWEDERTGHPEVWTRRFNSVSWTPEECVTCDGVASRAPVIADGGVGAGLLVWQEGEEPGTSILARPWDSTSNSWGTVETVRAGMYAATEPSVAGLHDAFHVAWTDARHGSTEIYSRERSFGGAWLAERRLTDLPGSSRHPSIHVGDCCGDAVSAQVVVAFENDWLGIPETWVVYALDDQPIVTRRVSADDGVASVSPSLSGYRYEFAYGMYWTTESRVLLTWTDQIVEGGRMKHRLASLPIGANTQAIEILSSSGQSTSMIDARWGTCAGAGRNRAELMALWTEIRDGAPSLIAKRGSALSGLYPEIEYPSTIVVGPEGLPANQIRVRNTCGETEPAEGVRVALSFSSELNGMLTWDETQAHPDVPDEMTDSTGAATLSIRAGGCSSSGTVGLRINGIVVAEWNGARSPDIDGDCAVAEDDLAYVQSKIGTSDFCADLDGSGIVDVADVAIVHATLGDLCTQLMDADDMPGSNVLGLTVSPNPCVRAAIMGIRAPAGATVSLQIYDASGRAVRDLGTGRGGPVVWDLRDDSGHTVASGIYFAIVRSDGAETRRSVIVLR